MADAASAISRPPPAPPTSGRDAPPAAPQPAADAPDVAPPAEPDAPNHDPAIRIASRLAQLRTGVQLLGDVLAVQDEGRPLLRTSAGDFAVEPTRALPARGTVAIVLTRVTPEPHSDLAGLIVAREGVGVDPPQPVRLTLVTLPPPAAPTTDAQVLDVAPVIPHAIDARLLPADAAAALAAPGDEQPALTFAALPLTVPVSLGFKLAGPPSAPPPPALPLPPGQSVAPALIQPQPGASGLAATPLQPPWTPAAVLTLLPLEAAIATLDAPLSGEPVRLPPPAGAPPPSEPIRVSLLASEPAGAASSLLGAPAHTPFGRLLTEGRLLVATVIESPDAEPRLAIGERLFSLPVQADAPHPKPGARLLLLKADPNSAQQTTPTPTPAPAPANEPAAEPPSTLQVAAKPAPGAGPDLAKSPLPFRGGDGGGADQLKRGHNSSPLPSLQGRGEGLFQRNASPPGQLPAPAFAWPDVAPIATGGQPPSTEGPQAYAPTPTTPPVAALSAQPSVAASSAAPVVGFLLQALGRHGFRLAAVEREGEGPPVEPLEPRALSPARTQADPSTPEPPRLILTLRPPTPDAPPLQAMLWFEQTRERSRDEAQGGGPVTAAARFHVDIRFPRLGPSRLSGHVDARGLSLTLLSTEPPQPALVAGAQAAFHTALAGGALPGRLGFGRL